MKIVIHCLGRQGFWGDIRVKGKRRSWGSRETWETGGQGNNVCGFGKAFSGIGWSPSEKSVCPCPWFLSFIEFLGCRHGWDKTLRSKYLIAFYYIMFDWKNICYRA